MPGAVAMTKSSTADLAARVAAHLQACAHPDARVVGFAPLSGETMEAVTEAVKAADAEMYATKRGDTLQPS